MEVLWPPDLVPASQTWNTLGNVAAFQSPFSGATKTYGRPGVRMGCTITLPMLRGSDRARWLALLASLKDRGNRIWMPDFSVTKRGSFPATELLTNNDFASGTTGWSVTGSLTVSDRVARLTAAAPNQPSFSRAPNTNLTQYAPYALRSFIGQQMSGVSLGPYTEAGDNDVNGYSATARGLRTISAVTTSATPGSQYPVSVLATSGYMAGDFVDCHWSSLSRCMLVDGGGNLLTHSDQIDNAAWTKTRCSVTANNHTAPDGTVTAEKITEDSTASSLHFFSQTYTRASIAEEWTMYGTFSRSVGTRNVILLLASDTSPTNYGYVYVNLGTGAIMSSSQTGTATNARASVVSLGGGYYYVALTVRLAATTSAHVHFGIADGSPSNSYTGDGSSAIAAWRCGATRSSASSRLTQSVASAVPASAQTGSAIYVKGLPASTSGILEIGDFVQIGDQINRVTSRLNSDAAGKGYLQCGNPWRTATNEAPIIVNTPMCKMMLATDSIDIDTGPGQFSPLTLELVEAIE